MRVVVAKMKDKVKFLEQRLAHVGKLHISSEARIEALEEDLKLHRVSHLSEAIGQLREASEETEAPGMTDLMVTPESIGPYMAANPLPEEDNDD